MTTKPKAEPKQATTATVHEVVVTAPNGHQSVQRVTAASAAEARKIVADRLSAGDPGRPTITDVAGPKELAAREREAEADVTRRIAAARDEQTARDSG